MANVLKRFLCSIDAVFVADVTDETAAKAAVVDYVNKMFTVDDVTVEDTQPNWFNGPYPSNTIQTADGGYIYTVSGPKFYYIYTDVGSKLIAGPPVLDPAPMQAKGIVGQVAPFSIPAYAAIYQVWRVAGTPDVYYVFLSVLRNGQVVDGTGWLADGGIAAWYDTATGKFNSANAAPASQVQVNG